MRARQRHLNPIQAGASVAFDTRYNTDGLTNGASVSTWTDRSGSSVSQPSSGSRPTWRDNSSNNINGSPVLQFDGSNDFLATAGNVTYSSSLAVVAVAYRPWTTAKYSPLWSLGYGPVSGKTLIVTGANGHDWLSKDIVFLGDGYSIGRAPRAVGSYGGIANNTPQVISAVLNSSSAGIWMDGIRVSTRVESSGSVPSTTAPLQIGGATATSDYGDFSIGSIALFSISLSSPMRRRLESACALSFKIPAS